MTLRSSEIEPQAKVSRAIRYCIASVCIALIVFWQAADAPIVNIKQMQVTEGIYDCAWTGGGRAGPSGAHIVDGILYFSNFTYFFGITPSLCINELRGRTVRMYYLAPINTTRRLAMELIDIKTNDTWGPNREKKYQTLETNISSKWIFYASKLLLLILVLCLTRLSWLKNIFQITLSKDKNHGNDR